MGEFFYCQYYIAYKTEYINRVYSDSSRFRNDDGFEGVIGPLLIGAEEVGQAYLQSIGDLR